MEVVGSHWNAVRPLVGLLRLVLGGPGLTSQVSGVSERSAFRGLPALGCGRSLDDPTVGGSGRPAPAGLPALDRGRTFTALAATVFVLARSLMPLPVGRTMLLYSPWTMLLLGRLATLLSPAVTPAVATDGMVCLVLVLARFASMPRRLSPFPSFRTVRVRLLYLTVLSSVPGVAVLAPVLGVAPSIVLPVRLGNFYLKITEFFTSAAPPAGLKENGGRLISFFLPDLESKD